jgi:hypothetical protein
MYPRTLLQFCRHVLQSLQAAIEGYSLNEGQPGRSADAREGQIGSIPSGSNEEPLSFTAWASVFPTAPYTENDFYGGALMYRLHTAGMNANR